MTRVSNQIFGDVALGDDSEVPVLIDYDGDEDDPTVGGVYVWLYVCPPPEDFKSERKRVNVWDSLEEEEQDKVCELVYQDVAENRMESAEREIDRRIGK